MAQQVSILSYLQRAPPALPTSPPRVPSGNTTNALYDYTHIRSINNWQGFNLATISQQFDHVLQNTLIDNEQMPTSPPTALKTESNLRSRISQYIQMPVRRALRNAFATHGQGQHLQGRTAVSFEDGDDAAAIAAFRPDLAYLNLTAPEPRANRAPGEVKPSWKWRSSWQHSQDEVLEAQFKQALSQVNWYMKQHRSRYGFILTDEELVAIRRLDDDGNLELATPILWQTSGTPTDVRLTVLLGLWYIGMLAAQDTGPGRWNM